jgi:hypothetical protein
MLQPSRFVTQHVARCPFAAHLHLVEKHIVGSVLQRQQLGNATPRRQANEKVASRPDAASALEVVERCRQYARALCSTHQERPVSAGWSQYGIRSDWKTCVLGTTTGAAVVCRFSRSWNCVSDSRSSGLEAGIGAVFFLKAPMASA